MLLDVFYRVLIYVSSVVSVFRVNIHSCVLNILPRNSIDLFVIDGDSFVVLTRICCIIV